MISKRPLGDYISTFLHGLLISFLPLMLIFANSLGLLVVSCLAAFISAIYLLFKAHKWNYYDYWSFNGEALTRGKQPNLSIAISEVSSIKFGLPPLTGWQERLRKLNGEYYYNKRLSRAQDTMLVYLDNNRVLPLALSDFTNGDVFSIYFYLSLIKLHVQKNETLNQLCEIVRTAKNEADYEQKAEAKDLHMNSLERELCALKDKGIIKNVNTSFSAIEVETLVFSKLNKVVQI